MSRLPVSLEADASDKVVIPWPQPLLDRYELTPLLATCCRGGLRIRTPIQAL